jgi:hypothetical protein
MREADTPVESVSEIHSVVSPNETTGTDLSGKPRGPSKADNKRERRKDSPNAPKEKKKHRSEEKGEKGPAVDKEADPGRQFLSDLGKKNHPLPVETPAKAPAITSLTTGTSIRMSERDFQVLDAKRSSLYIAPPKSAKKARIKEADFDAAIDWVQKIVGKLTSVRVLPAYFVATLQDEQSRDRAYAVLRERRTECTWNENRTKELPKHSFAIEGDTTVTAKPATQLEGPFTAAGTVVGKALKSEAGQLRPQLLRTRGYRAQNSDKPRI